MAASSDVAMNDVEACATVELGVLEPFARVELAVRAGRVVEDLRDGPDDVFIIVEDLIVISTGPDVAFHEDRVGYIFFI